MSETLTKSHFRTRKLGLIGVALVGMLLVIVSGMWRTWFGKIVGLILTGLLFESFVEVLVGPKSNE